MPIWKEHPDLMGRLAEAQNHPANINQDVMIWAAFCDAREELERHVVRQETRIAEFQPKKTRKRLGA
jgi:hypothetical protein